MFSAGENEPVCPVAGTAGNSQCYSSDWEAAPPPGLMGRAKASSAGGIGISGAMCEILC